MSNLITIDGTQYDVPIVSMKRTAESLYKFAERTVDGVLHSEIIGVYFNYQLVFGKSGGNQAAYAALFSKLTEPTEYHTVIVPDESGDHEFVCYFSNIKDTFARVKGSNRYIEGLSVNIIARAPART
jgi:hypothetical protein